METQFRRYFRDLCHKNRVWTVSVEHRSGGTTGVPDLLVQRGDALLPVECKVGDLEVGMQVVHSSRVRPAQIRLLDEAWNAGISAFLLIGVSARGGWDAYLLRHPVITATRRWRTGFPVRDLMLIVSEGVLLLKPDRW